MSRERASLLISLFIFFGLASATFALEKVRLGSSVRMYAGAYLPALAAEEKGIWKENGLEVEWVPLGTAAALMRAVAAGTINIGTVTTSGVMTAAGGGLPIIMVAELVTKASWKIWVTTDSPYQQVRDLKGKRVGVTALGGVTHAFGRIIARAHGVEDIRFVGAGGAPPNVAALKAGSLDASVLGMSSATPLKVQGVIREIATAGDYVPKPWFEDPIFSQKDFARREPDTAKRLIKAALQAADFVRTNPRWAMDKMKSFQGLSEEGAKLLYDDTAWSTTGRIDRRAVENLRKVFIEYGIITDKAPAVDELFTNEYLS